MSSHWIETAVSPNHELKIQEVHSQIDEDHQRDETKASFEMLAEGGEVVGFIKTWQESDGYAGYVHFDTEGNVVDWKVMKDARHLS